METSILLARILGPLLIVAGAGVLLNSDHYRAMAANFLKNAELYYFSGTLAFTAGVAMILHHNIWVADWRVVITLIGWSFMIKGAARILFPTMGSNLADNLVRSRSTMMLMGVILLAAGGWLAYHGFKI